MSNRNTEKRYQGLRKIYQGLTKAGYYKHGHVINYDDISDNLNQLNLLVHKTYLILKSNDSEEKKINKLIKLKDPEGNQLVNEAIAKFIIDRYSEKIVDFYDEIYESFSQFNNQKGGYPKEPLYADNIVNNSVDNAKTAMLKNIEKIGNNVKYRIVNLGNNVKTKVTDGFKGTYVGNKINKTYTKASDIVKDIYKSPLLTRIEELFMIDDFLDIVDKLQEKIGFDNLVKDLRIPTLLIDAVKFGILKGPRIIYKISSFVFNWTFFPIYMLENLPIVGIFYEIPLDIMSIMIDNSDLFFEPILYMLPMGFDMALKLGSMVPGLAPMIGIAKIPLAMIRKPLELYLENGADILGLMLNIERKQFGLAYISALELFPTLPPIMDTIMTNLYMTEKWLRKGVRFTEFISDIANATDIITEPYIDDPTLVFQPKYVWDEVVYPNKDEIPFLREVPFESIETVTNTMKRIKNTFI